MGALKKKKMLVFAWGLILCVSWASARPRSFSGSTLTDWVECRQIIQHRRAGPVKKKKKMPHLFVSCFSFFGYYAAPAFFRDRQQLTQEGGTPRRVFVCVKKGLLEIRPVLVANEKARLVYRHQTEQGDMKYSHCTTKKKKRHQVSSFKIFCFVFVLKK